MVTSCKIKTYLGSVLYRLLIYECTMTSTGNNRIFTDQYKNQTVYLLYTFNNNEENKQKGRHKDGKK